MKIPEFIGKPDDTISFLTAQEVIIIDERKRLVPYLEEKIKELQNNPKKTPLRLTLESLRDLFNQKVETYQDMRQIEKYVITREKIPIEPMEGDEWKRNIPEYQKYREIRNIYTDAKDPKKLDDLKSLTAKLRDIDSKINAHMTVLPGKYPAFYAEFMNFKDNVSENRTN